MGLLPSRSPSRTFGTKNKGLGNVWLQCMSEVADTSTSAPPFLDWFIVVLYRQQITNTSATANKIHICQYLSSNWLFSDCRKQFSNIPRFVGFGQRYTTHTTTWRIQKFSSRYDKCCLLTRWSLQWYLLKYRFQMDAAQELCSRQFIQYVVNEWQRVRTLSSNRIQFSAIETEPHVSISFVNT